MESHSLCEKSGEFQESDEESCVRLFLSADLVGSTAFKNSTAARSLDRIGSGPPWLNVFQEFYRAFPSEFEKPFDDEQCLKDSICPKLVKTIGDELLLQTKISNCAEACQIVHAFERALVRYTEKRLATTSLLLKGAAWIAGFPINNSRVLLQVPGRDRSSVFVEDFVGPSIDTGFRIAKLASPQKLIVSVDLAILLLRAGRPLQLYFDGTESFKGVLGGRPYPIIWYRLQGKDSELHEAELLLKKQSCELKPITDYCDRYLSGIPDGEWLHVPYLCNDNLFSKKPPFHEKILEELRKTDKWNEDMGPKDAGR